jgi:hypothetical protein
VDSKHVSIEIRRTIGPILKEAGFVRSTSRTFWRHTVSRIELLNFQSFNSYLANLLGCTTYSFSVNMGSYLVEIPPYRAAGRIKEKNGKLLPQEYECHFRGRLRRGFQQPELLRSDIWFVDPECKYLEAAVHDVRKAIIGDAFPWYEKLRDSTRVFQILLTEPAEMDRLWGFGANPSPIRSYLAGYVALALGRRDIAKVRLQEALESGCFERVAVQLTRDIEVGCRSEPKP